MGSVMENTDDENPYQSSKEVNYTGSEPSINGHWVVLFMLGLAEVLRTKIPKVRYSRTFSLDCSCFAN